MKCFFLSAKCGIKEEILKSKSKKRIHESLYLAGNERNDIAMRRKWLAGILCAALAVSLAGCGKTLSNEYISIEKYEGLEVEPAEAEEVTDEMVESSINSALSRSQTKVEITDRAAQDGDTVNIDYTGSFDGEEFSGGADTGADLVLGAGKFLGATDSYAGFEDQIVGHRTGEEFDITVQFPETYKSKPEYASKVAVFHIKLNGIYELVTPELTDEWVQANGNGAQSTEEYREQVRSTLEQKSEYAAHQDTVNAVFNALLNEIKVKSYPEGQVEEQKKSLTSQYEYYAQMYGMDLAAFLSGYMGMTEEEFNTQAQTAAENYVKVQLACELIGEKKKLESTGEKYEKDVEELAKTVGYDDVELFKQSFDEEMIKSTILQEKVAAYLLEKSVPPSTADGADAKK